MVFGIDVGGTTVKIGLIENDKIYYVCNDDAVMESVAKISYGRVANQGLITQKE